MKVAVVTMYFLFIGFLAMSQKTVKNEFEEAIQVFEEQDQLNPAPEGAVLFVGSSSIRVWKDMQSYFPNQKVLNRGFGGSEFSDLLYFSDRIIYSYSPSRIFIYEGDNDISNGESPQDILAEASVLRDQIRDHFPEVPVIFISPKPSVKRWDLKEEYEQLNELLLDYTMGESKTEFADVWTPMLDESGMVFSHVFISDSLHMNAEGYVIWEKVLTPFMTNE